MVGMTTIFRGHLYDKKIQKIQKMKRENENLRVEYIILKSNYEYNSSLSQVEKRANTLGLFAFKTPPKILK